MGQRTGGSQKWILIDDSTHLVVAIHSSIYADVAFIIVINNGYIIYSYTNINIHGNNQSRAT